MSDCQHQNFRASVRVGRLSENEGGPITGFEADVTVACSDCGLPFRFIGVAAGNHYAEPRCSVDGLELRAPIEPAIHAKFTPSATYTMPPRARN